MSFFADSRFRFSVTRLIKLSKNQKPTRDSFIGTLGSSVGDASQISLNSFMSAGASSKLGAAQAELQACEAHLADKERELDERRVSAVRRGLQARCKAMVECGWNWGEMGKEGLRALEGIGDAAANGIDGQCYYFSFATSEFTETVWALMNGFCSPKLCSPNRHFPLAPVRTRCARSDTRALHTRPYAGI